MLALLLYIRPRRQPLKLCSYVVKHDTGLAPNPFWGWCTLALCTTNHQGCRLQPDDWIIGNSSTEMGRRLIYAMRVTEVLDFDTYYHDPRFASKRACDRGWQERCGDNIYYRNEAGGWSQSIAFAHTSAEQIAQDTRHPRVFVSDHYFYFGDNAPRIPQEFTSLLQVRQGCKYHTGQPVSSFIEWLERTYEPGLSGEPRDREEEQRDRCRLDLKGVPIQPTPCTPIASNLVIKNCSANRPQGGRTR